MAGMAKNGVLYPSGGVYGINDNIVSPNSGWSSQKVMNKLASIKSIMRVDEKPTIANDTITYIKDGTTYTTTDSETWFYYVIDNELYKTIFIDGVEYTKADSGVSFDDFIEKDAIATTVDGTTTHEQVLSAKLYYDEKNTMLIIGDAPEHRGQSLIDIIDAKCTKNFVVYHVVFNGLVIDKPDNESCIDGYCDVYTYTADLHKKIIVYDVSRDAIYERTQTRGVWGDWVTIFSRNNDIVRTSVTVTSSNYSVPTGYYEVINNICYVTLRVDVQAVSPHGEQLQIALPLSKITFENSVPCFAGNGTNLHYVFYADRGLCVLNGEVGGKYIFSFSYPVAENWRP